MRAYSTSKTRRPNTTPTGELACAFGNPWMSHRDCEEHGCCDADSNQDRILAISGQLSLPLEKTDHNAVEDAL